MASHRNEQITKRIDKDFTYHRPPMERVQDFTSLREKAKELAHLINELVPDGREKSTALTLLEQSNMQANAGIARQYPAEKV